LENDLLERKCIISENEKLRPQLLDFIPQPKVARMKRITFVVFIALVSFCFAAPIPDDNASVQDESVDALRRVARAVTFQFQNDDSGELMAENITQGLRIAKQVIDILLKMQDARKANRG